MQNGLFHFFSKSYWNVLEQPLRLYHTDLLDVRDQIGALVLVVGIGPAYSNLAPTFQEEQSWKSVFVLIDFQAMKQVYEMVGNIADAPRNWRRNFRPTH